jgi:D-3-phosphoglycerate dehydrogenase / 2-oxoglutarate reductase
VTVWFGTRPMIDHHGAMARILVTEQLAEGGLAAMRDAGHEVDERMGLSPDELLDAVKGAHALVIRSATKVTEAVLAVT